MQMPSTSELGTVNYSTMNRDRNTGRTNDPSLHNKLANFVLELQTDVRLEDLLDNDNNNRGRTMQTQSKPNCHIPLERKELHVKHLRHLYQEIINQQRGAINGHEEASKRRQGENSPGFARNKVLRNSEACLLHDMDCIDETWLMSFAAQLGLDKKMDLPELNSEFMQGLL